MSKKEIKSVEVRSLNNVSDGIGDSGFVMESLTKAKSEKGIVTEAHRHDYYHVLYIKNGAGTHIIDFITFDVKDNSMFFISPGQIHQLKLQKNVEGFVLTFNADFFHLQESHKQLSKYPFFHTMNNMEMASLTDNNRIDAVLNEMYLEYNHPKRNDKIIKALMVVLFEHCARQFSALREKDNSPYLTTQIRSLETLIETNFKDQKNLDYYADQLNVSPKHLNDLCKKALNKSVTNLIHERIILEAKRLLHFTDNTVTQIGYQLGFSDKSYFMRFFKKQTSFTAEEFRKRVS